MSSKEDKRLDIIGAAVKVFAKDGYHKAKIEQIAKEAGIGKGTIYEYFESKTSLFQEMIQFGIDKYRNDIYAIIQENNDTRSKLISISKYHGAFLVQHINLAQVIVHQTDLISEEMKCWLLREQTKIFSLIANLIKEGISRKELREDLDVEIATLSVIGTINQYYSKRIFIDKESPENIDPSSIVDTLYKGLE